MTSQKDKATSSNRSCMDNRQSIFFNIFINLCLMRDFIALTHINNNNNSNNNKPLCVCRVLLKRGTGSEERGAGERAQGTEEKEKRKKKQRIGNEFTDRARVQVTHCSHFLVPRSMFPVLVPPSCFSLGIFWRRNTFAYPI